MWSRCRFSSNKAKRLSWRPRRTLISKKLKKKKRNLYAEPGVGSYFYLHRCGCPRGGSFDRLRSEGRPSQRSPGTGHGQPPLLFSKRHAGAALGSKSHGGPIGECPPHLSLGTLDRSEAKLSFRFLLSSQRFQARTPPFSRLGVPSFLPAGAV